MTDARRNGVRKRRERRGQHLTRSTGSDNEGRSHGVQDAVRNERRPEHDDGAGRGAVRAGDLMRRTLFAEHHRAEFSDRVSGGRRGGWASFLCRFQALAARARPLTPERR